jgi:hypothetical protein
LPLSTPQIPAVLLLELLQLLSFDFFVHWYFLSPCVSRKLFEYKHDKQDHVYGSTVKDVPDWVREIDEQEQGELPL